MSNFSNERERDNRVILAWIILAIQILGLLWLLLFGRDRLAAMSGADGDRTGQTAAVAQATPAATDEPTATAPAATAPTEADVPPTAVSPATAEADASATDAVIAPEDVLIEPSAVAPEWLATLVEQPTAGATGQPSLPPHLLLTFVDPDGDGADTSDSLDLDQPQLRIIPIATLLNLLEQNNDQDGQDALQDLLSLLQQQPDPAEASIPVPPILGEVVQNFVSRPAFRSFGGGSGVGYITHLEANDGDDAMPATNESGLHYVYQGISADGEQYVFMSWPVDAAFLPETNGDMTAEEVEALQSDRVGYFDGLREQVDAAADGDLSPQPSMLAALLRSLSLYGQVAEAEEQPIPGTAADAIGFNWYWTGSAGASGETAEVDTPQNYSLVLWPDGTYTIRADCNIGSGTFTYDESGNVQLNPGPLTRVACPEGSRDDEFIRSLLAARTVAFDESGDMVLGLEDGGTMTLANVGRSEPADVGAAEEQTEAVDSGLAGVTLQWSGFTDDAGDAVEVDNPENYLLTFLPDGRFSVVADCNVGGGVYTFGADGALQLGPIRLTRVACPEGSRGDEFAAFLESVSGARIGDDGSVSLNTDDGRSATFLNLGEIGTAGDDQLETAGQPAPSGDPLNTVWQWTGVTDANGDITPVDDPEAYYLVLIDDGTYAFRADCNNGAGGYTLDGDALTLLPAAVTLAACDDGSLSDAFVGHLGRVRAFAFDADGNLNLALDDGSMLSFANGGPFTGQDTGATTGPGVIPSAGALTANPWQWTSFRDMKQDEVITGDYTITFYDDGTAAVVADCNTASGTYALSGDAGISISVRVASPTTCPPGSWSNSFVEYLNFAGLYFVENGRLTIELMADGGTMTFGATQ